MTDMNTANPSMTAPASTPTRPTAAHSGDTGAPAPAAGSWRRWSSEPLLHFVLLGGVLFGADLALSRLRDDGRTITVPTAASDDARAIFKNGMGREPTAAEMKVLLERWVDNEVLYREGLAQGLDRGDAAIRERVIFKALNMTQSGLSLPPADDAKLRAWFEQRRERYDQPARFDFLEAVPVGGTTAGNPAAQAQALVDMLNGKTKADPKAEMESSLRVFRERPRSNLVQSYGEPFTKALETATPGAWLVLTSTLGPHVVRLETLKPGTAARYDDLRDVVRKDWQEQTLSQMTTDAVREMGKKYKLEQDKPATTTGATAATATTEKAPS